MLYDKEIKVLTEEEGYTDDYGIWHDGEKQIVKTIYGDVQPYSSELLYKDYGFRVQCTKRVFCDVDSGIHEGTLLEIKEVEYKVMKIIEWNSYMELMIDGT